MPLSFTCPHCGLQTDVAAQYAGQSGPCAGCGQPITVPGEPLSGVGSPPNSIATARKPAIWLFIAILSATLVATGLVLGLMAALLAPALTTARSAATRATCQNNLRAIGAAMEAYRDKHGTYPPAYTRGGDGQPMHSWRVLLLPFLGAEAESVYSMYDLSTPWNSQQNQVVATLMPSVYACPNEPASQSLGETNYCLVVGPGLMFDRDHPPTPALLARGDGAAQTMMVVETVGSTINWLQPQDLTLAGLSQGINAGLTGCCQSSHPGGAHVLMADQRVVFLPEHTTPEELRAMATIHGGEIVDVHGMDE